MAPAGWEGFFTAQAAAFAALTGLVFVALSINLKQVLAGPGLPGRAGEAVIVLAEPLLIGLIGLIPGQTVPALGWELLAVGAAGWLVIGAILFNDRGSIAERPPFERGVRVGMVQAATLPFVVGGALLAAGSAGGLNWIAAGTAACLIDGLVSAWVLLVEILR